MSIAMTCQRESAMIIGTDVVVPMLGVPGVAAATLEVEGIHHYLAPIKSDTDYARWLGVFWKRGQSFIILEDDMAPWPGALAELADCDHDWCAFNYLLGTGHLGGWRGLGCVRFSAALIACYPRLYECWVTKQWNILDDAVFSCISDVTGLSGPHEHGPPIAHVKHYRRNVMANFNLATAGGGFLVTGEDFEDFVTRASDAVDKGECIRFIDGNGQQQVLLANGVVISAPTA